MTDLVYADVPVAGTTIASFSIDGEVYIPLRNVCDNLGLDWSNERRRIKNDPILSQAVVETTTALSSGQKQLCLPLRFFPGWIFKINLNLLADDVRPLIEAIQIEGYDALHDYWIGGAAINPRKAQIAMPTTTELIRLVDRIQTERQPELRAMFHAQLAHVCTRLDLPLPALEAIGEAEPAPCDLVKDFFIGVEALQELELTINHSRNPDIIALRLSQVGRLFAEHEIGSEVSPKMRAALKHSSAFIAARAVNSALAGKAVHCWCFERSILSAQ